MINKIHNRGTGSGSGPVEYLLGKDGDREDAKLLRGDPETTINLIDSSKYQKKYTSGVLSFAEPNITKEQKQEIMDSFEYATFPGLEHDQYQILWVEHLDKDRLELNYVIPNLELSTGKRLQPYYHKADSHRMNAWQNIINDKFVFSDPHDPANKQINKIDIVKDRETKEIIQAINNGLYKMAEKGAVTNRSEVVNALESAGLEIARTTKNSISIKNPSNKRNIRLKGYLYEQDFRLGKEVREGHGRIHAEFKENRRQRLQSNRSIFKEAIERKRNYHTERYQKSREPSPLPHDKNIENIVTKDNGDVLRSLAINIVISDFVAGSNITSSERINNPKPTESRSRSDALYHTGSNNERRKKDERSWSSNAEREHLYNNSRRSGDEVFKYKKIGQNILSDRKGKINNDRDRESLIRSIKRITDNLRPASEKLGGKLQQFAKDVHNYEREQRRHQEITNNHHERRQNVLKISIGRQQEHHRRNSEIRKTANHIQRTTQKIREVKLQSQSCGYGLSM